LTPDWGGPEGCALRLLRTVAGAEGYRSGNGKQGSVGGCQSGRTVKSFGADRPAQGTGREQGGKNQTGIKVPEEDDGI